MGCAAARGKFLRGRRAVLVPRIGPTGKKKKAKKELQRVRGPVELDKEDEHYVGSAFVVGGRCWKEGGVWRGRRRIRRHTGVGTCMGTSETTTAAFKNERYAWQGELCIH